VRNPFSRKSDASPYPKNDSGSGQLKDYGFDLIPTNKRVAVQLADSDPHQDELAALVGADELQAFVSRRTAEEERTDAPLPVRFFVDSRMTAVVGFVPPGLEPVIFEAMTRLENAGKSTRIPAEVVSTKNGYRVNLKLGLTR
jgi:hypothetical protein